MLAAAIPLALVACAPQAADLFGVRPLPLGLHHLRPIPLAEAMRSGQDLGPIAASTPITLTLDLIGRDPAGLQALVSSGAHVTTAEYANRFGPDPAAVASVTTWLQRTDVHAEWRSGSMTLSTESTAVAAENAFNVSVHNFIGPDGTRFRAPVAPVPVPPQLRQVVRAVIGFNTYPAMRFSTLTNAAGMRPSDIETIYDIGPLHSAGLDGTGITVVFPENSAPLDNVLSAYASKWKLPPFGVTVKTDPSLGPAVGPNDQGFNSVDGETEMDLEIVHAIAPAAKLVVYAGAGNGADQVPKLFQAIANDFPNNESRTVIMSSSLGINQCESRQLQADEMAFDTAWQTMAGHGVTAYDASGDYGAYCAPGVLGVYPDVASPNVTAVGGTTVFQAADGGYSSESAWGDPVDQIGGGGGVSSLFKRPSWQDGPGVTTSLSNGFRQVPDVAGPADPISPWSTAVAGSPDPSTVAGSPGDGTSAAAPFWSGITALIYQDLANKKLTHPGFIAPVLYALAQSLNGSASNPFHDVTTGSDLYHAAAPGWDFASGWGSPDAARLADALESYQAMHPSGTSP